MKHLSKIFCLLVILIILSPAYAAESNHNNTQNTGMYTEQTNSTVINDVNTDDAMTVDVDNIRNHDQSAYQNWKSHQPYHREQVSPSIMHNLDFHRSTRLGLLIPNDSTFIMALDGNDDYSTLLIQIPFAFTFYGTEFTSIYINNNGNITFGSASGVYTPTGFPYNNYPMLAPFWADVDTRPVNSGKVYYHIDTNRVIVIWDNVGYYNSQSDKLNRFELIITNASDSLIGLGNNVAFSYSDMQWTTGSASNGVNGFGGTPATVGVNKGDGINYSLIGRFDHEGNDYDGPGGINDGISYLDDLLFVFDVSGNLNNIPPIASGVPTSPLNVCIGDTISCSFTFISPEAGQITNAQLTSPSFSGFSNNITAGNPCLVNCFIVGNSDNVGNHTITYLATDDGVPPRSTMATFSVTVVNTIPVFISSPSLEVLEDSSYQYNFSVFDPDCDHGDVLSYELVSPPFGMVLNADSTSISWIPDNSQVGNHNIIIHVNDSFGGSVTQNFTLTVINVNDPPSIDLPLTTSFVKGDTLVFNTEPYITDVDSDHFRITVSGNQHIQSVVDSLQVTFTCNNWEGTEMITVTVSDSLFRLIASDSIAVSVVQPLTCNDIQYTINSSGNSPYNQQTVSVEGIVTGTNFIPSGFYIGDPGGGAWSGLFIYSNQPVQVGDKVLIKGTVQEYNNMTEIYNVTGCTILSHQNTLPLPTLISCQILQSAAGEPFEGVLVEIESGVVSVLPNQYQEFYIRDFTGSCQVDDGFYTSTHTWTNISLGQLWQSITGLIDYSFGSYAINPRNNEDMILSTIINCYAVQHTSDSLGVSPLNGQTVQVQAIVTAVNPDIDMFWIGDALGGAWSGLSVYCENTVAVGDLVRVTGTIHQYYGQTELYQVTSLQIISSNNALPAPTLITPGQVIGLTAVQYEGVLVKIEQISVTQIPDANHEFIVNNQTGSVRIDNRLYPLQHTWQNMDLGRDWRSITGILDYLYSSYRIIPRSDIDMIELKEFVVVENVNENNIQIIDTSDNVIFGPYLSGQLGNNQCSGTAVSPRTDFLLISSFDAQIVYHIDINNPFNPTIIASYNMGFSPEDIAISQDGRYALIADGGNATYMAVIDLESRTTVQTVDISPHCAQGVSIGPDGKVLINDFTNQALHQYRLNLGNGTLSYTGISVTNLPGCINTSIHPSGNYAVINQLGYQSKVISLNSDNSITVIQTLTEFTSSQSSVYSYDGTKVFFLSSNSNPDKVFAYNVLDNGTLSYIRQYSLSSNCTDGYFGLDPITTNINGSLTYAANSGSVTTPNVDVINTITQSQSTIQALSPTSLDIGNLSLQTMFIARQTQIDAGDSVQFIQYSTGGPETFLWNFGDGSTSTLRHPLHVYSVPGTYSVTLTITSGSKTGTLTKTNYITVIATARITLSTNFLNANLMGENTIQQSFTLYSTGVLPVTFQINEIDRRIENITLISNTVERDMGRSQQEYKRVNSQHDHPEDYMRWLQNQPIETRNVSWLSEAPASGSISPGDSVVVIVTFNSTGLDVGMYSVSLEVASNDLVNPLQYIDVSLAVSTFNITTNDNENNGHTGTPDGDMDIYLSNHDPQHPIEFNIFVNQTTITDAQLSLLAWDVDETGGEVDHVYINGHFVGALTGANDQWSTSVFNINPTWINPGPYGANLIEVFINVPNIPDWMTSIDWGQLVLNQVTHHATIRSVVTSDSVYAAGMNINITQEIDTDYTSQVIRIETNILDPDSINVDGASSIYTITGNNNDAVNVQRLIPAGSNPGIYQVQTIVYDNNSNIQQDICYTPFTVVESPAIMSFNVPALDFGTVYVTDSLSLSINIANIGYNTLNITQFSIPNNSFQLSDSTLSIPRLQSRSLQVKFKPLQPLTFSEEIQILSNSSTGSIISYPITAQSLLYPVPIYHNVQPEQTNHNMLNAWQIVAGATISDSMIVDASTLQYRFDRNGNGVYDTTENWINISGYTNSNQIELQQPISWRRDGEHLSFEFRVQNIRHSGWCYTGFSQSEGISDDYYVSIDATPPLWIEQLEITDVGTKSVSLTWEPSEDEHFASYEIYYANHPILNESDQLWDMIDDPVLVDVDSTSTTITGLRSDSIYYFAIRGRDSAGNHGDFSDEISASTLHANIVQNPQLKRNGNQGTLFWDAFTGASNYKIYQADSPLGPWTYIGETSSLNYIVNIQGSKDFFNIRAEILPTRVNK